MFNTKASIQAQLIDADEEFDRLVRAEREYANSCFKIRSEEDLSAGILRYRLTDVVPPPESLSIRAKKMADALRPPLEHLVTELIERSPHPDKAEKRYFPICLHANQWPNERKKIKGMRAADEAMIRSLQPFAQTSGKPEAHPLALLQTLSNKTKHNFLLYVKVNTADPQGFLGAFPKTLDDFQFYAAPLREGEIVATIVPSKTAAIHSLRFSGTGARGGGTISGLPGESLEESLRRAEGLRNGSGPWAREDWDDFFKGAFIQATYETKVRFGGGSGRSGSGLLDGLEVVPTIQLIRNFVRDQVLQPGGIIEEVA